MHMIHHLLNFLFKPLTAFMILIAMQSVKKNQSFLTFLHDFINRLKKILILRV